MVVSLRMAWIGVFDGHDFVLVQNLICIFYVRLRIMYSVNLLLNCVAVNVERLK